MLFSYEKSSPCGGDGLGCAGSFGCLLSGKDDERADDVLHIGLEG
jgi:hypothetical protein